MMAKIFFPAALWLVFITVLSVMPGVHRQNGAGFGRRVVGS